MNKLSVLVPVYNEARTISELLRRVLAAPVPIAKEVLVCDDGSTDGTREILTSLPPHPDLRIVFMDENVGRGGVLKHLLPQATGDIIIHQDADLEYDPAAYGTLLEPILAGEADVVYGSRFKGEIRKMRAVNNLGNRVMSAMARLLYGIELTDLMTCYKMYRADLLRGVTIHANGFNFEAEFTAKLARRGARFREVPISFVGRTHAEGKKIRAGDAIHVIQKLISCRLSASPGVE
ncbi:MAG TPA: glycosyltransferase family 2 protein [Longimicrobiales bacterium]